VEGIPDGDRDAGTEQGANPSGGMAEVKIAGVEKNLGRIEVVDQVHVARR
jgi:hypothetical protein